MTAAAASKILEIMVQENIADGRLRFAVRAGGCAGFSYDMFFDEKEVAENTKYALAQDPYDEDRDVLFHQFGVTYIADKKTLALIRGTTVDYVETLQESGFKFNNPRSTATCGCEKSFA